MKTRIYCTKREAAQILNRLYFPGSPFEDLDEKDRNPVELHIRGRVALGDDTWTRYSIAGEYEHIGYVYEEQERPDDGQRIASMVLIGDSGELCELLQAVEPSVSSDGEDAPFVPLACIDTDDLSDATEFETVRGTDWEDIAVCDSAGEQWHLAKDESAAGRASRDYWKSMAEHDPDGFVELIGSERLVEWALGRSDNFGISSLGEFLDVAEERPEEELAGYDCTECSVNAVSLALVLELGFIPELAYRNS